MFCFFTPQVFKLPLNAEEMQRHSECVEAEIRSHITEQLKDRLFSLTVDIGSRHNKSFLAVGAQYMKDYKVIIVHLGMLVLHEKKTATDLKAQIQGIVEGFGLQMTQVYNITVDNAANVVGCSKDLLQEIADRLTESLVYDEDNGEDAFLEAAGGEAIRFQEKDHDVEAELNLIKITEELAFECSLPLVPTRSAAHTVQLAIYDSLAPYQRELEHIKAVALQIRNTIVGDNLTHTLLPNWNATRWGSLYRMIVGLLKVETIFGDFMEESLWKLCKELSSALEPLEELSTKMQKEQYVFGDFFLDVMICQVKLERLVTSHPFRDQLQECLKSRKEEILEGNLPFLAAVYLDSRFNYRDTPFLTDAQKEKAREFLLAQHQRITEMNPRDTPFSRELSEQAYWLLICEEKLYGKKSAASPKKKRFIEELMELEHRIGLEENYLGGWRSKSRNTQDLVQVVFGAPASQVSVERTFSSLPFIFGDSGERKIEMLLFVRLNRHLIAK